MPFERIGVIGAGTMGSGIATNIAGHGFYVQQVDISSETLYQAQRAAEKFYARNVETLRMDHLDSEAALARLSYSENFQTLADCDLVIEAIFERMDIKMQLYDKVMPILKDGVILGTNTSCLRVSALAEAVSKPHNFIGIHYINPPTSSPSVEVVKGAETAPEVVDSIVEFCNQTNKKPVLCKDSSGFALNRFFCPYANEAARLFDEKAGSPAEIDRVASDVLGAAAGPFVVMNLVGMQVMSHAQNNLAQLGPFYSLAKSVEEKGLSGEVWLIDDLKSAPEPGRDSVIADRLLGATFLPILQALDEEVASPADIDMGAQLALKFGKPPCVLMDRLGTLEVERLLKPFAEKYDTAVPVSLSKIGKLTKSNSAYML